MCPFLNIENTLLTPKVQSNTLKFKYISFLSEETPNCYIMFKIHSAFSLKSQF